MFLNDLVDPMASLTLLSELMNYDFSGLSLDAPITDELIQSVSGIRGLVQNIKTHIGGDTVTLGDLAGHRATLLQGPRFVGTGTDIADQMEEWFDGGACDGFVIAATHTPGAYEDVVRLVVPELQRRGVFRDRYHGTTLREHLGLERPAAVSYGCDRTPRQGIPPRRGGDGVAHQPDDPADAAGRLGWVHLPVHDHALVAGHAPQHVQDGRRHGAVFIGPGPGACGNGGEQCLVLALLGIEQRRIERLPGVRRVRGDVGEDAGGHVGHILELHAAQVDPGFVLELVHHRVVQPLLVGEVPVDGAFVDACPFGHGPDGEPVPVPHRRTVQELGAGGDDAGPCLGGPPAPQGAVIRTAGRSRRGGLRAPCRRHGRHGFVASTTS